MSSARTTNAHKTAAHRPATAAGREVRHGRGARHARMLLCQLLERAGLLEYAGVAEESGPIGAIYHLAVDGHPFDLAGPQVEVFTRGLLIGLAARETGTTPAVHLHAVLEEFAPTDLSAQGQLVGLTSNAPELTAANAQKIREHLSKLAG